jgi:hypothetical protein
MIYSIPIIYSRVGHPSRENRGKIGENVRRYNFVTIAAQK